MLAARRRSLPELLGGLGSYALRVRRRETAVYRTAHIIETNLFRPLEDLLAEQDQAIAAVVNHAYLNSPFYHAKYDAVGFKPGDVKGRNDLRLLPTIDKLELSRNVDDVLCYPKETLFDAATGGTSGVSLKFYRDRRCLELRRGIDRTTFRYYGWRDGQWQGWLWGAPRDLVTPSGLKAHLVQRLALRTFYLNVMHLDIESYRHFAGLMRRFRPTWVSAYPSLAYELALRIESGQIDPIRVPTVNLTAEPAYGFQKEKIREVWADNVFERYGLRECGLAALECPERTGLHCFTESVCFETIDAGPAFPGRILLVTDLMNYGMPLIRYETGDFAEISDAPCNCGRSTPRLHCIQGRETDTIWCPDGHGVAGAMVVFFTTQMNFPVPVQVVQESLHRVVIRVACTPPDCAGHILKLVEAYKREISPDITYDIEYVDQIERAPSGKYRYVISHVKPPTVKRN